MHKNASSVHKTSIIELLYKTFFFKFFKKVVGNTAYISASTRFIVDSPRRCDSHQCSFAYSLYFHEDYCHIEAIICRKPGFIGVNGSSIGIRTHDHGGDRR
jgi:hypothetical protein